ncbi:type II toxin-antitoxin system RelE family toxin [Acidaminobacter hydrogenoformans]|uniref:mRNA interferase RelE/StbE n=1 Tax=Acidaminobacter hydrogenoformans DSM 2784 TaxID=1120920 RepID=A0A1G5RRG6_9FIRM|nr:type II toxin-antitoxin system RelE/ParE family toxin [Acidaminobacter hydrogenoformans]SCZ76576.1 mRNA interferase RelE/StbE [Acidaminobacter hydrogenoformans DSM 2784]
MKSFKVEYTTSALKQLKKLDKQTAFFILSYIEKNLVDSENPRLHGKSLQGLLSDKWRYRVGDYRILAKIEEDRVVILIVEVGHRKDIYG